MYPTNGQPQAPQTFNGQGQVPYMAAPAGAPSVPPTAAPVGSPQMGQQPYVPTLPAQPPTAPQQIGGGYSGPQIPQYGFGATQPPAAPQQPQQYAGYPQQLPPQLPAAQTPAAPAQVPSAPAQAPVDLAAAIQAQGFQDPSQLIARLPQLQALAQYGAQALAQQGQQPNQPQQPEAGAQPEWAPPPYDPSWERFLDVDENTGRFVAADPALMHYANQANAHRDWLRGKSNEFWRNPYEFIATGLKPRIENEMLKPLQQKLEQVSRYIEQQQLWDGIAPYEHILYAQGPQGQLNYQQPTPAGQAFNAAYAASAGFTNNGQPLTVEQRIRFALGQVQSQQMLAPQQPAGYLPAPQQQYQPMPAPQQPQYQPQPQQQWQPTPPGINPAVAQVMQQQYGGQPNPQESFLNRAIERAQQAPPQPGYYVPGQQGSLITSAELGIAQSPSQSFEALCQQTARELGISL